jgi:hypothetical protein
MKIGAAAPKALTRIRNSPISPNARTYTKRPEKKEIQSLRCGTGIGSASIPALPTHAAVAPNTESDKSIPTESDKRTLPPAARPSRLIIGAKRRMNGRENGNPAAMKPEESAKKYHKVDPIRSIPAAGAKEKTHSTASLKTDTASNAKIVVVTREEKEEQCIRMKMDYDKERSCNVCWNRSASYPPDANNTSLMMIPGAAKTRCWSASDCPSAESVDTSRTETAGHSDRILSQYARNATQRAQDGEVNTSIRMLCIAIL